MRFVNNGEFVMRPFSRAAVLASVFLCIFLTPVIAERAPTAGVKDFVQTWSEPSLYGEDPWVLEMEQRELYRWLRQEKAALEPAGITLNISPRDLAEISDSRGTGLPQVKPRRYRVGVGLDVGLRVDFSKLPTTLSQPVEFLGGVAQQMNDGFAWTIPVHAPDARALRVHFDDFDLPQGTAVYIFSTYGEAFGPYTGTGPNRNGEFWSHTLSGETLAIHFRTFDKVNANALPDVSFSIASIGYMGERFQLPLYSNPLALNMDKAFCSYNAFCIVNAEGFNTDDWGAIDDARNSVAQLLFQSGRFYYLCTGGLIEDTDANTQVPLFVTANHCISKRREANSLEAYFFFSTGNGYGCDDTASSSIPRTLGSSILRTSRTSDHTLLQLDEAPPAGSVFMGFNSTPVAFSNGTDLYRISHPGGAPQAFSSHDVDTSAGTCNSWPRGNWIYSRDVIGGTEGGSSGSPVMNAAGQIVGQLSGGCGTNINDDCDSVNNATVDGALAAYFDSVSEWLDPAGGPGGGGDMHVDNITLGTQVKGRRTRGVAPVTIVDSNGDPVSGADVTGSFSGDVFGTKTATTGNDGMVDLRSRWTRDPVSGFQFCVDDVNHASLSYAAGDNVETCDNF